MIDQAIIQIIASSLFTIILVILFYMLKQRDKRFEKLENKTNDQEVEITELKSSLWSEDKLSKMIASVIRNEFLTFENKLLNEGRLRPKNAKTLKN